MPCPCFGSYRSKTRDQDCRACSFYEIPGNTGGGEGSETREERSQLGVSFKLVIPEDNWDSTPRKSLGYSVAQAPPSYPAWEVRTCWPESLGRTGAFGGQAYNWRWGLWALKWSRQRECGAAPAALLHLLSQIHPPKDPRHFCYKVNPKLRKAPEPQGHRASSWDLRSQESRFPDSDSRALSTWLLKAEI